MAFFAPVFVVFEARDPKKTMKSRAFSMPEDGKMACRRVVEAPLV
jgi:hypothetical protein